MGHAFTIVVTGGSCSGKTSLVEEVGRTFGHNVSTIPEAASWVIGRRGIRQLELSELQRRELQREIYAQQIAWEATAREQMGVLLLDRGTVDGAAYWPGGDREFWEEMSTSHRRELARYDMVVWLETAATLWLYDYDRSNPSRTENLQESIRLGTKIRLLWRPHPHVHEISATMSFADKRRRFLDLVGDAVQRRLHET